MSMFPFLLDIDRPRRLSDQHFALALTPEDILTMVVAPHSHMSNEYYQPWRQLSTLLRDTGSTIKSDRAKFQINLDVQHFAPEDIAVRAADGFVIIEGRHGERRDEHGWVSRQFTRRYTLPEGCSSNAVQSRLSSDGVLTVTAPLERSQTSNERVVPIIQTGPVRTQPDRSKYEELGDGESPLKEENGQ